MMFIQHGDQLQKTSNWLFKRCRRLPELHNLKNKWLNLVSAFKWDNKLKGRVHKFSSFNIKTGFIAVILLFTLDMKWSLLNALSVEVMGAIEANMRRQQSELVESSGFLPKLQPFQYKMEGENKKSDFVLNRL